MLLTPYSGYVTDTVYLITINMVSTMCRLFDGDGKDSLFVAIRDEARFADIRLECERLWCSYSNHNPRLHDRNFVDGFSRKFHDRFWEMYLGVQLLMRYPDVESAGSGPDFVVSGTICVEATVASRGEGTDAVPDITRRTDEDNSSVPFKECVLRITSSLREKAKKNDAENRAKQGSYVVAVNLPFPEAWLCGSPPLATMAALGLGGSYVRWGDDKKPEEFFGSMPSVEKKKTGSPVSTTAFQSPEYDHVSALLVASVNPFSSAYERPAIEVLHNPRATKPLPRAWLRMGNEYWVNSQGRLECTQH